MGWWETDEESDEEFKERFPKLLSLLHDNIGLVFSTPGPEVGSEALSAAQTPPGEEAEPPDITQLRKDLKHDEDSATPHLTVVKAEYGKFDHVGHLLNRPVEAHWIGYGDEKTVVRGLLRYREGEKTCAEFTSDPYLIVENFGGMSGSGSSSMEMTALALDDLAPQELRDWNQRSPVEFIRFVFEDYMTKGW